MSDTPQPSRPRRTPLRWAILALLLIGAGGVVYVIGASLVQPAGDGLDRFTRGSLQKMVTPQAPGPAMSGAFVDADGRAARVADFRGAVTVVNLWATWCAPCRTEMPTLATLQRAYADRGLRVVAISLDRRMEEAAARRFIADNAPLGFFHDPVMATYNSIAPRPLGLPVTLIYDARGRERARLVGDGEWDSPEARGLIEALLAESAPPAQAPESAS